MTLHARCLENAWHMIVLSNSILSINPIAERRYLAFSSLFFIQNFWLEIKHLTIIVKEYLVNKQTHFSFLIFFIKTSFYTRMNTSIESFCWYFFLLMEANLKTSESVIFNIYSPSDNKISSNNVYHIIVSTVRKFYIYFYFKSHVL